jgi:Cysteine-rich secretory protein family
MRSKTRLITVSLALLTLLAGASPVDMSTTLEVRDTSTSSVAPLPSNSTWYNGLLAHLNPFRLSHHAVPFVWSNTLASYALTQANKCQMKHSGGPYGENIYWISSSSLNFANATVWGIDAWMSEESSYKAAAPGPALHYTALMWQASKRIGCAWTSSACQGGSGGFYLFCEFDPMGNIVPLFPQNVYPSA